MTGAELPLAGLTVLEVSSFVAAPLCGMTLGQLGAQVIRVGPMLDGFQHVAVRFDSPQMGLGGMRLCNLTDRSHMPPAPRAA